MEMDNVQNEIIVKSENDGENFFQPNFTDMCNVLPQKDVNLTMRNINAPVANDEYLEFNVYLKVNSDYSNNMETLQDHDYDKDGKRNFRYNKNIPKEKKLKNCLDLMYCRNVANTSQYPHPVSQFQKRDDDSNNSIVHNCELCGKEFKQSCLLKNHVRRIHFIEKKFKCSICHKKFAISNHLKNHYLVHTGEKNYSCSMCAKTFRQKGHLSSHIKTHTGVKNFSCPLCNKRFTQNIHMKSHLKIHTGEKNYCCKICYKQFTQSGHLQMHMTVHTGERRYKCSHCNMRFKQSGHLSSHLKRHSKINKPKENI